jgi:hypothetical protein
MLEYESLKHLFDFLKVKKKSKKHYTHAFGWVMGEHTHLQVLKTLKLAMMRAQYLSITCD